MGVLLTAGHGRGAVRRSPAPQLFADQNAGSKLGILIRIAPFKADSCATIPGAVQASAS
jgi:hypothetical protein